MGAIRIEIGTKKGTGIGVGALMTILVLCTSIAPVASQPDFVVGDQSGEVELFMNINGSFVSKGILADVGDLAWGLASGDFNGDNYPDFIVGDYGGQVELFLGPDFASAGIITDTGREAYGLAVGDYNNDGYLDFVVGDGDGELELFMNNGSAFNSAGIIGDVGFHAWGITSNDFDGDGDCDFCVGDYNGTLELFKNDGTGSFSYSTIADLGNRTYGVTSGDYDGDGDYDLLATAEDGNVTLFKNDGTGSFANCGTVISLGSYRYGLESNDFDADGDTDVLGESSDDTVNLYKNDGTGNFSLDSEVASPGLKPRGLTSANFIMPDLVVTQIRAPAVYANVSNVIIATMENAGNEDATEFETTLYVNSSEVKTITVSSLEAGASTDVCFSWTPTHTGAHTLRVMADPDNAISEFNESNNEKEQVVTVCEGAMFPPTSFFIYGFVFYKNGTAANAPCVVITNTRTGEEFIAENATGTNYYQVLTDSRNVSEGDILHFDASAANESKSFDHAVTQAEMNAGGFELNITIQRGICGDVNDDGSVTTMDGMIVFKHYFHPEQYPLSSEWAADVNCDGSITTMDGMIIFKHYFHPEEYPLNCC